MMLQPYSSGSFTVYTSEGPSRAGEGREEMKKKEEMVGNEEGEVGKHQ